MTTIYYEEVDDTLEFTETLGTNQHLLTILDFFEMVDNDSCIHLVESITQSLLFAQTGKYTITGSRAIVQSLAFNQSAKRTHSRQVYQNFPINQLVDPGHKWPLVNQVLSYREQLLFDYCHPANDLLTFTQTTHLQFIRVQHIVDNISFAQFPTVYKPDQFYIGPTYQITPLSYVYFQSGNVVVSLRPPEFGNTDSLEMRRIQRETRGGDLIIYRDPAWTITETLELKFTFIDDNSTRAMQNFVRGTLGNLITYTDHESRLWVGFFNNPDFEITTPGRFNNSFTIKFEVIFI